METDFINGTFLTLVEQRRIKEAVEFCEQVVREAPSPELKCFAKRNLAELHFFHTGDAPSARQANMEALGTLEASEVDLVRQSKIFSPQEMGKLYTDLCEQLRQFMLSSEEYETYIQKVKRVRPLNETEQRGLASVLQMRDQNIPWKEYLFSTAESYVHYDIVTGQVTGEAFGQAASIYCHILTNRSMFRLNRQDINVAIQNYGNAILDLVNQHLAHCDKHRIPINPDNLKFIINQAIKLLNTCKDDRNVDERLWQGTIKNMEAVLNHLSGVKNQPSQPPQLPQPPGCAIVGSACVWAIAAALMGWYIYTHETAAWYHKANAALFLIFLVQAIYNAIRRSKRK